MKSVTLGIQIERQDAEGRAVRHREGIMTRN